MQEPPPPPARSPVPIAHGSPLLHKHGPGSLPAPTHPQSVSKCISDSTPPLRRVGKGMRAGELHQGPSANRVPKWPLVSAGTDTVIPYYFLIGRCTQFSTDMESWVCRHSGTSPGSPWQVMEQLWARGRRVQGRRAGGRRARVGTASGGSEVRLPGMPVPAYGHCLPQPVFLAVGGAVGGSPWPSCRTSPPLQPAEQNPLESTSLPLLHPDLTPRLWDSFLPSPFCSSTC